MYYNLFLKKFRLYLLLSQSLTVPRLQEVPSHCPAPFRLTPSATANLVEEQQGRSWSQSLAVELENSPLDLSHG